MIAVSWISPIQIHTRDSTYKPPTVNSSPLTRHTIFCSQSLCFIRIVLTCYLSAWIHLSFLFQLNLCYRTLTKNFFDAYKLVNIKHWILSIVSMKRFYESYWFRISRGMYAAHDALQLTELSPLVKWEDTPEKDL